MLKNKKPNSRITNYQLLITWSLISLNILVPPSTTKAIIQKQSIVINEIAAFEPTDHEWIEIVNPTDHPIDLTDWKLVEGFTDSKPNGINHALVTFRGDFLIAAGEHAIITQNAENFITDYPALPANLTILDSSWGTLSESGEQIALKDSGDNIIEQFIYLACPEFSLERKDPNLIDYSENNWQQHASSSTPGQTNSVGTEYYSIPIADQPTNPEVSTPIPQTNNNSSITNYQLLIILNEILPNPEGPDDAEFIELKNLSSQVINLKNFVISDSSNKIFTITNSITIEPGQFWVLPKIETKISLNNSDGDMINLYQPNGVLIDSVYYSEDAENNWSYSRKESGIWSWTTTPTKNQENIITLPPPPEPINQKNNQTTNNNNMSSPNIETINNNSPITNLPAGQTGYQLLITEILPNPVGSDQTGEWVEIFNPNNQPVDITGWKIGDNSSYKYTIKSEDFESATIEPGEYFILPREITNLTLNNSGGDAVKLYYPNDNLADSIEYSEKCEENSSYVLIDQDWFWTITPTPAAENTPTQLNSLPQAFFEIDGDQLNIPITFDASESLDPENQPLSYIWNLDGTTTTPTTTPIITHTFTTPGKHNIQLTVQDAQQLTHSVLQTINITQSPKLLVTNYELLITEFFPNPAGTDENQEWIEIYNPSYQSINLIHCKLDDIIQGGSRAFLIEEDIIIQPNQYLVFTRNQTKLALNNTYDSVRLIDPFDNVINEINYDDVPENMAYALDKNNNWFWTSTPTPGEENKITALKISLNTPTAGPKKYDPILTVDIDKIRQYDIGDQIKTTGIVSVEPGILGKNIFYIYSPELESGIQIYSYHKDFPDLKVGDIVEIKGTLSQSMGEERLKISSAQDITTLNNQKSTATITAVEPKTVHIEDLSDSSVGSLVSISGEVIEIKGAYVYIDDGTEELKIYLKQSTDASTKNLEIGDRITITGIFSETTSGFRLLPRSQQDIKIQKILGESTSASPQTQQKIILEQTNRNQTFIKYLLATIIALLIILVGLFIKKKK